MNGYCQNCLKMVDVVDPTTIQMPNRSFIHRGNCSQCSSVILVKIHDHEILIDNVGHRCPAEMFAGAKTPNRILKIPLGQTIHYKNFEGSKMEIVPVTKDKTPKTLAQIKKELEK